ncbi:MAG TPA: helix-turn-helix transcriptional regulator [Sphingomonas sp.]|nr:helix-turn-helix transcriptional regulator [Sphingomonas sp.]
MTVQFVEIAGQKMAVLPVADYERLIDAAEDREDGAAAQAAAERRQAGEEYLPAALVDRILNGENALKVWRQYRGRTQEELSRLIGLSSNEVGKLERGEHKGTLDVWSKLAAALNTSIEDLTATL